MNLTVRIHDKEYKEEVAQGITFSEEYNETLDSGTVRLTHVRGQIKDLKPYDDVYIYDSDYDFDSNIGQWRKGGDLKDNPFYRHLLVDQFSEEIINLSEGIFSYTIELFSETKGLEVVQCPNVSVTQPLNVKKKVDIYTYLVRFTNLYSPKYKTIDKDNAGCWTYTQKYRVAPELEGIFSGFYSQDFTLSNPTLRDILSTLMITKDMIPYVKDNVIYAKDISKRTGTYDIAEEQNAGRVNRIVGQMSSADYCDGVRRQYSDALSSDGVCNFVEYLGFRNKDEALMTLTNMGVEVTHKLYKIKKFNLCYYRDVATYDTEDNVMSKSSLLLCKQDMTPLVKVEQEWNWLSQDWRQLEQEPKTIEALSKYKIGTVYYSIGGKSIKGWGTHYQQYGDNVLSAWDITKTYIENIIETLDSENKLGNGDITFSNYRDYYKKIHADKTLSYIAPLGLPADAIQNVDVDDAIKGNSPLKYKTVFFEIEYEGFYDGAIIHTRDKARDNIYQNDNVSSSLTLLEKDGINQKEKLNRFANKTHIINGRLDGVNYDIRKMLQLGNTGAIGNDDDVIIYRREYSIYNNYIVISYAGIQDYVLRNFYTSVYAKYRVNQLMSYGESINRAENKKVILLLSKDNKYKNEETFFSIKQDEKHIEIQKFFSAFKSSEENGCINAAVITTGENQQKKFFVDLLSFYSGNIMCFNIAMNDNASGGNFIESWSTQYQLLLKAPSEDDKYFIGSEQQWYNIVDDDETGAVKNMSFSAISEKKNLPLLFDVSKTAEYYSYITSINSLKTLPKATSLTLGDSNFEITTGNEAIFKDNKDKIDMTLQVEPISNCPDIVIGNYLIKLSDLLLNDPIKKVESDTVLERWDFATANVSIEVALFLSTGGNEFWIATAEHDAILDQYLSTVPEGNIVGFSGIIDGRDLVFSGGDFYFNITGIYWRHQADGKTERVFLGNGHYKRPTDNKISYITELHCPFEDYSAFADKDIPLPYKKGYIYKLGANQFFHEFDTFSVTGKCTTTKLEVQQSTTLQKNMFIEFSNELIDKNIAYKILPASTDSSIFSSSVLPKDVFSVMEQEDDGKIRVILNNIPSGTKSIRYWYFDFDSAYKKNYGDGNEAYISTFYQSGYHFVFGVNITETDISRGYIDIYITETTNRDERVFDGMGRQVGIIHNCVDKEGNYIAPTQQEYDTINEYPEGDITITLQSAMGNHTKQWKCYQSEIIQPNFSIDEKEYKAKHGTSVKYWIDGSGKKHNDGYAMVVNNNEMLTFYGEDWWKTLDISNMSTVERHLSPTYIDDTYVGTPRSLPKTFNITGDIKAYPVTVKGTVELTIEYNGKTTYKSHDFSVELEEFDDKTEIPNPVFGITTDDQDATSIFSLYYRKYTPDDDYKLVWQIRTTLTGANYEDKGELTLKAGVAINEIIQPYLLQE